MHTLPQSLRLRLLFSALQQGQREALAAFWAMIASQGTPLIESASDDPNSSLVTFLWRAIEPTHNVVVAGWLVPFDISQNQMVQLLDTELWYITYQMPNALRATYFLSPNDSLVPYQEREHIHKGERFEDVALYGILRREWHPA